MSPSTQTLIALFNQTFSKSHNTQLVCCEPEPIYRPASTQHSYHRIIFAHGFFASALHEIAHWCIAGPKRRKLEDYGYWYEPDGRSAQRQFEFEKVEVKPQALEWIFSVASLHTFHFSADNLDAQAAISTVFQEQVHAQVKQYLTHGMPADAEQWSSTLINHYRPLHTLDFNEFKLS